MNKHVLMLTAATVALMAGPAFADHDHHDQGDQSPQKTERDRDDLTIDTGGSVVITDSVPAITIDSPNTVTINATTTVSNLNTDSAIGVQLDAMAGGNGPGTGTTALDNFGKIDLTGSGTNKIGILVNATNPGDSFLGDIKLESGSTTAVKGDGSIGLEVASDATLDGSITILGQLSAAPTDATSTTAGNVMGVQLGGTVTGDVVIGVGGAVQAVGTGANGMVVLGHVMGRLENSGNLEVVGTTAPKTTGGNAEAGSALIVGNSVDNGIYNGGPASTADSTTRASLGIKGAGPAVRISPNVTGGVGSAMNIGVLTDATDQGFSFLNRGSVTAASIDPNLSETAILMGGSSGAYLTLDGGIFNGGVITSTSSTDSTSPTSATALSISGYVTVNALGGAAPYAITNSDESNSGQIKAILSGTAGGAATAIDIAPNSIVPSLGNMGTISASATTTDTTVSTLTAYGIRDRSGSLLNLYNSGTIAAGATTLDNGNQVQMAVDLSLASNNVTFDNPGVVSGDVALGAYNDTLDVNGTSGAIAAVTGNIDFGGTNGGGFDTLIIGTTGKGQVAGAITEEGGGRVNVTVGGNGTLTLQNTVKTLQANDVTVQDGGILNISLTNGFNQAADATNPALITTNTASLTQLSKLNVSFGGFISTPGGDPAQFTLIDAGTSILLGDPDAIYNSIHSTIPYLFKGTICGYNVTGGFTNDAGCTATPAHSQLTLSLAPKTAAQVGLTGQCRQHL